VEGGIALTVTQVDMIVRLEKVIAMTMIAGGGVVVHRVEDMMIITEIDIMINITMIIIEDLTMTIIMAEIHPGNDTRHPLGVIIMIAMTNAIPHHHGGTVMIHITETIVLPPMMITMNMTAADVHRRQPQRPVNARPSEFHQTWKGVPQRKVTLMIVTTRTQWLRDGPQDPPKAVQHRAQINSLLRTQCRPTIACRFLM
jgi:hypothetical protein